MRNRLEEIERGSVLPADCVPVDFSGHSVEAANDRHLRRLELDTAKRELCSMLERATVSREAPQWLFKERGTGSGGDRIRGWLIFERERLALPLFAGRGRNAGCLIAGTALTDQREVVGAEVRLLRGATQRERGG